uniref:Uncharacterized protein n=1 Tax=Globodera rostochiensis TaxID=31243 RepID=A0A914HTK6_GLORO
MQTPIGLCPIETTPLPPPRPARVMNWQTGHAEKQAKNEWQVLSRKTPLKEAGKCRQKTSVVLPQPKPQLKTIWQTLTVRRQSIKKPILAAEPTVTTNRKKIQKHARQSHRSSPKPGLPKKLLPCANCPPTPGTADKLRSKPKAGHISS